MRRLSKQHAASVSELCVRTAEKNRRFPIRVIEHLQTETNIPEMRCLDDDPDLDTVAFPNNVIRIEIEGDHNSWVDEPAVKFREDIAVAVEELAGVDNYGGGSGVGCRHAGGLAKSDADGATVDNNNCLSLGCAEREKGQQKGDEH